MSIKYVTRPLAMEARVLSHSLYKYVKEAWPYVESNDFIDGWHVGCICEHLEAVSEGKIAKLLINIPPGCSKSLLCAVMWPTWEWTRDPKLKWFFASYDQELSTRDSLKCRTLIKSRWYQERWGDKFSITDDQDRKTRYSTDKGGYRLATSVGGHGTGEHPHRIVCFPYDEKVMTETGLIAIGDIVNRRMKTRVPSMNPITSCLEYKPVIGWHKNPGNGIVEVMMSNGDSIRCTPSHRIWTLNRGWVKASLLVSSDVLPCFAPSNTRDRFRCGAESFCQCRSQFITRQDIDDVIFGKFTAENFVSSRPVIGSSMSFGDGLPSIASSDLSNCCGFDFESLCKNFDGFSAFGDFKCLLSGQNSPWSSFEDGECAMLFGISNVVGSCSVAQIGEGAIHRIPIEVSDLVPFRTWTDECFRYDLMYEQVVCSLVFVGAESRIPSTRTAFENSSFDGVGMPSSDDGVRPASDSSQIRYTIQSLESGYCSPTLVRFCGFAHETFCLTVEDNHSFIVGDHNCIIVANCDDPHSVKRAESEVERQAVLTWWDLTMSTRGVAIDVRRVIIMQRLHKDDLSAHVLRQGGWEHINLCMRHEKARMAATCLGWNDPRKEEGELLCPNQFDEPKVSEMEKRLGAYGTAGQLQQRPVPKGGSMFKAQWFSKRLAAAPFDCKRIRFWDRACIAKYTMITALKEGEYRIETVDNYPIILPLVQARQFPIQDIKEGDAVLTAGKATSEDGRQYAVYDRVVWSGQTGKDEEIVNVVVKGSKSGIVTVLSCTKEHVVFLLNRQDEEGKGSMRAWDLKIGDHVILNADFAFYDDRYPMPYGEVIDVALRRHDPMLDVYDIETEVWHQFFANGILVHNSTADGGCFTAGTLLAKDMKTGAYYIEHVAKGQWEPAERNAKMRAIALRDRAKYGPKHEPVIWVEREGGSSGRDAWLGVVRALEGFVVKEATVTGSKDVRAEPWATQLAAGNVYVVDNGESQNIGRADWDIQSYIEEHELFRPDPGKRLGSFKDQVDSSSGAYNLFAGQRASGGLRVYNLGQKKKGVLRIVVCTYEELPTVVIQDHRCLLIDLADPPIPEASPDNENGDELQSGGSWTSPLDKEQSSGSSPDVPVHALTQLIGSHRSVFANIEPKDYQANWNDPVLPWNQTPENLILTQDTAKRLWAFLMRRRDPNWESLVIVDKDGKKSLSVAMAVADVLRLPRDVSIYTVSDPEAKCSSANVPNFHVYEMIKGTRHLIAG